MAEKSKKQSLLQTNLIQYYKWEFLRRDKYYIKDFNDFLVAYKKIFLRSSLHVEIDDFRKNRFEYFLHKYGIKVPLNPDISAIELDRSIKKPMKEALRCDWKQIKRDISKFIQKTGKRSKAEREKMKVFFSGLILPPEKGMPYYLSGKYKAVFLHSVKGNFICNDSSVVLLTEKSHRSAKIQKIEMDINTEASLKKILEDIKFFINLWYLNVKKEHRDNRIRLSNYDAYIKIYDLCKEGKTYREIAKIVYPEEYQKLTMYRDSRKDAIQPLTEKVKNNFQACQKLIEKGYKIIR